MRLLYHDNCLGAANVVKTVAKSNVRPSERLEETALFTTNVAVELVGSAGVSVVDDDDDDVSAHAHTSC